MEFASPARKLGKARQGKDFALDVGPYIVLKDEIPDPQNVGGELRVNGEPRIRGNTREMRLSVAQILEYHTQDITFYAGDIVASGGWGHREWNPTPLSDLAMWPRQNWTRSVS